MARSAGSGRGGRGDSCRVPRRPPLRWRRATLEKAPEPTSTTAAVAAAQGAEAARAVPWSAGRAGVDAAT